MRAINICFYGEIRKNIPELSPNTPSGKCPEILNTKVSDKWHMQTVQTQIRLLLKEQPDQGLHVCHSTKYFLRNNCAKSKI